MPAVSAATLAYDQKPEATYLVNDPYTLRNTSRVSSPFTVESESPYRFIPTDEPANPAKDADMIVDQISAIKSALEKTGISGRHLLQNQKINFTEITDWVQNAEDNLPTKSNAVSPITHIALATVGENKQEEIKAAIAIAPDDMTISAAFIDKAAEHASRIVGKGLLVIIAFAFEASARTSDLEQRGKLRIIKVQANRDLQIGNLKDNKTDHAFVMIGEPDVEVNDVGKGLLTVEILGYDTYNPATGNVDFGDAGDIACWMIDSNYNGTSFYARHIHFPQRRRHVEDSQIKRLKRQLGKNLDQDAWDAMISHKSMPFEAPKSGRIAVRIITSTHTEMTTVIDVSNLSS